MEERLKELKTKITSFIKDYNIKDFSICINNEEIYYSNNQKETRVNSVDISLEV